MRPASRPGEVARPDVCTAANLRDEDFTGEVFQPHYFTQRGGFRPVSKKESQMAWKAPKVVEVPCGMEINMYACAARK